MKMKRFQARLFLLQELAAWISIMNKFKLAMWGNTRCKINLKTFNWTFVEAWVQVSFIAERKTLERDSRLMFLWHESICLFNIAIYNVG